MLFRISRTLHEKGNTLHPPAPHLIPPLVQHTPRVIFPSRHRNLKIPHKLAKFNSNIEHFFSVAQSSMEVPETTIVVNENKEGFYSVWAIPPDEVRARVKKLMEGLRSEFGGPQFEPHVTVVGAISLTADDALEKFKSACNGLKAYNCTVDRVATGTFFYQCVYLLLHPTAEVAEPSSHCCGHFGYKASTPYMPHLSLLYGDLTDDEKKKAQEKAYGLDESIGSLSFPITRLQLWKTDTEDTTLKSWEMVAECNLNPN